MGWCVNQTAILQGIQKHTGAWARKQQTVKTHSHSLHINQLNDTLPCVSVNRSCLGTCSASEQNTTGESNSAAVNTVQNIISLWTELQQAASISFLFLFFPSPANFAPAEVCGLLCDESSYSQEAAYPLGVCTGRDFWLRNATANIEYLEQEIGLCFHGKGFVGTSYWETITTTARFPFASTKYK